MQDKTFSLDLLISRIEELQRIDQLQAIKQLTHKNHLLQEVAVEYQKYWCRTIELLERTQDAVLELQGAIYHFSNENQAAEIAWLALWGIERPAKDVQTQNFAGWI